MKRLMIFTGCAVGMMTLAMAQDKAANNEPVRMERHSGMGMGAMEGDMPMMPIMKMNKELGLSKEQMQQMKAVISGSTNEMRTLSSKMQEAAKTQAELMGQDSPNEEAVMKGVDEIAKIRAEIGRIRMKQMLAIQKILTPEQRAKMREKMKEQMEKRGVPGARMKHKGEGLNKGPDKGPEAKAQ